MSSALDRAARRVKLNRISGLFLVGVCAATLATFSLYTLRILWTMVHPLLAVGGGLCMVALAVYLATIEC